MIDELKNGLKKNLDAQVRVSEIGGDVARTDEDFATSNSNDSTIVFENISVNLSDIVGLTSTNRVVMLNREDRPDFDILYQSDNPLIWALGIAILQNFTLEASMEASQESIEFAELVAKSLRQKTIDQNGLVLDLLKELIEEDSCYRAGISPSGKIKEKTPSFWDILVGIFFLILFVIALIFQPMVALGGLALLTALYGVTALIANVTNGSTAKQVSEILGQLNPITVFLDVVFDTVELIMIKSGASKEDLKKLKEARMWTEIVVMAVITIAIIVAAIVIGIVGAPVSGGTSLSAAFAGIMAFASIISGFTQVINGFWTYRAARKKYDAAETQYKIDSIRNVIESLKSFLEFVQDNIDAMIDHMKNIIENMNSNWSTAAEMIKNIGSTNVGVARSISI